MEKNIVFNGKQAAAFLGASYWSINELCKQGKIPFYTIGNRRLFRKESLERWQINLEMASVNGKSEV